MLEPIVEESLLAEQLIRDIPDFPRAGILFKDITPVLSNPDAMREVIDRFLDFARAKEPTIIVGIESRGFVFGMPLALELGLPFVPVRKSGKLPYQTIQEEYALEYGVNSMEVHTDAIVSGDRVIIVDDLLATGGTASAAKRLVNRLGGSVEGFAFLIELQFLQGRLALENDDVLSLLSFD
ncbi:MAG: adenine phosphoribosyltransferase [Bacteroidota bacterium]|nr:adenine phosphoribosyltransferase [Bacteroidota bacterium]MDP4233586.1 adenine phosphoribosyltransferase [Bacteroidota bacterium]MDP4243640.1 adenine phosphoribosyltransferase [Bacteroidota bacterium]MDP4287773.1 adenine phosphoribosyltransferase [Bacteroidota bacterium]